MTISAPTRATVLTTTLPRLGGISLGVATVFLFASIIPSAGQQTLWGIAIALLALGFVLGIAPLAIIAFTAPHVSLDCLDGHHNACLETGGCDCTHCATVQQEWADEIASWDAPEARSNA